jgi:hypothetical protein
MFLHLEAFSRRAKKPYIVAFQICEGYCLVFKKPFFLALDHGPLTKGRITQRFLSEGVMETFLTKMFILASREG